MRGATLNLIRDFRVLLFQPTRPLRGATANAAANDAEVKSISTHAPLAGRDFKQTTKMAWDKKFQPTRPLRGATSDKRQFVIDRPFQPTRPLRGATAAEIVMRVPVLFQPTRPLRGATLKAFGTASSLLLFQPTRPLRGATCGHRISAGACRISTHAPLAGRDYSVNLIDRFPVISTHAPLAGRDSVKATANSAKALFQPTRPLRGATRRCGKYGKTNQHFNPRAPCGARQQLETEQTYPSLFQPTRPLRGATRAGSQPLLEV